MSRKKPHIILIMTDQQRFDTVGAWGYDHMVTPNIDRIAREGVSFRQAYCPAATCVPSRAATFTGRYPHTTGVYSFNPWAHHRSWVHDLAENGYWCVSMGKMHLKPRDAHGGFQERVIVENPTNKDLADGGADDDWGRYLSFHGIERPNDRHIHDPDWLKKCQGVAWHEEERFHSDVFIGHSAVTWIERYRGDSPVFLQVGFTGPHEPWDPLARHLAMYEDKEVPPCAERINELDGKPARHLRHLERHATTNHESRIDLRGRTREEIARMKRHYFAKITTVDEQIGRVLDALENRGWLENSLLVFCSDHGELLGDHGLAYKWLMYDPIVHVPLIVRYPGSVDRPGKSDELVSLIDVGPTVLEAAGVRVPPYFEGQSLMPLLRGEKVPARNHVFCEDDDQMMIRSRTHKLVYYIHEESGELYDLQEDPDELWNLWDEGKHRHVRDMMVSESFAWLAKSNFDTADYKRIPECSTATARGTL